MGRVTWESLGGRPLPGRRNNWWSARTDLPGVECFRDFPSALEVERGAVWFFGGARIYREAMPLADFIDLVDHAPDYVTDPMAVMVPTIDHPGVGRRPALT